MKFFLHQHVCSQNPETAFKQLEKAFSQAQKEHCDMLIAPEVFMSGFAYDRLTEITKETPKQIKKISDLCAKHNIGFYASFFSALEHNKHNKKEEKQKPFNQSVLIDQNGKILSRYNKKHLIPAFKEDKFLSAGKFLKTASYTAQEKTVSLGLSICYDLRFPELFRAYGKKETEIFLLCAQWPSSRVEHLLALAKARAIENQAFMVLVNATGLSGKTEMAGNSLVIDPLGKEITNLKKSVSGKSVEIDLSVLKKWRDDFPALYQYSRK